MLDTLLENIIIPASAGVIGLAWFIIRKAKLYAIVDQRNMKTRIAEMASREELEKSNKETREAIKDMDINISKSFDRIRSVMREDNKAVHGRIDDINQRVDRVIEIANRRKE